MLVCSFVQANQDHNFIVTISFLLIISSSLYFPYLIIQFSHSNVQIIIRRPFFHFWDLQFIFWDLSNRPTTIYPFHKDPFTIEKLYHLYFYFNLTIFIFHLINSSRIYWLLQSFSLFQQVDHKFLVIFFHSLPLIISRFQLLVLFFQLIFLFLLFCFPNLRLSFFVHQLIF